MSPTMQDLATAKTRIESAVAMALCELEHEYGVRVTEIRYESGRTTSRAVGGAERSINTGAKVIVEVML